MKSIVSDPRFFEDFSVHFKFNLMTPIISFLRLKFAPPGKGNVEDITHNYWISSMQRSLTVSFHIATTLNNPNNVKQLTLTENEPLRNNKMRIAKALRKKTLHLAWNAIELYPTFRTHLCKYTTVSGPRFPQRFFLPIFKINFDNSNHMFTLV